MKSSRYIRSISTIAVVLAGMFSAALGQTDTPPAPGAPKTVSIPPVQQKRLKNGLEVAVVERKTTPLVTVQLLIKSGAASEAESKAGLANLTASMLTKGTKARNATQIAEDIEFLGGSLDTGAGWNNSVVTVTVTPDKLEKAMSIMSDVVLNPKFDQEELELLRSQTIDGLTYNLKQPSFLANYVASKYSFKEHPAGGTPSSLPSITTADIAAFHAQNYYPGNAVLIFAGDISLAQAVSLGERMFGTWKNPAQAVGKGYGTSKGRGQTPDLGRILVVDLPNSGQAAVNYVIPISGVGRSSAAYYPASVFNSVLGGGYSSRLNMEIRIKRGLSYGAGSSLGWRSQAANFSTRAQTKNESAAQVAELVVAELKKLTSGAVAPDELVPRKSVLTGNFGRNLETTSGLAGAIGDLYSFGIPAEELNKYVASINGVADTQIREFASRNLLGGDMIIVGDAKIFMDDLKKRFPTTQIDVIKASDLDMSKDDLKK
jgi:zinc protease